VKVKLSRDLTCTTVREPVGKYDAAGSLAAIGGRKHPYPLEHGTVSHTLFERQFPSSSSQFSE